MADENNKANNHDHDSYVKVLTRDHSKTNSAQSKAANINILNRQIANQQKYFNWYSKIPLIILIIILTLTVIGTIVGVISLGVIALAEITLPGVFLGLSEYFLGRIMCSQKILTVLYLQKLNEEK